MEQGSIGKKKKSAKKLAVEVPPKFRGWKLYEKLLKSLEIQEEGETGPKKARRGEDGST